MRAALELELQRWEAFENLEDMLACRLGSALLRKGVLAALPLSRSSCLKSVAAGELTHCKTGLNRWDAFSLQRCGRAFSNDSKEDRRFHWIEPEAEDLIARAYARHRTLADTGKSFPPSLSLEDLEAVGKPYHYPPR